MAAEAHSFEKSRRFNSSPVMGWIVRREFGGRSRSRMPDQANPNFETLLMAPRDVHNNVDIHLRSKKNVEKPFSSA
jgi:hypothetical protein